MLQNLLARSRYLLVLSLGLVLLALAGGTPASAAPPSPSNPAGKMLGIVPAHQIAGNFNTGGSSLVYHNGPVMLANKVYAIYWVPSGYQVSTPYVTTINKFFTDVGVDSGKTSNVYYSDTQYGNSTTKISYTSSLGGYVQDTNPYPASGCAPYSGVNVCLTDAQLQTEIQRVMSVQGWTASPTTEFFMFTAKGVGSCDGSSCAFTYYCAYHSWIGSGSSAILYANMPYTGTNLSACGVSYSPNGDVDSDSTINVTSHEHNETITDPQGSAWYDRRGYENGDKCAWNFGAVTGNYNQTINGHHYILQQEWSNKTTRCVLTGY